MEYIEYTAWERNLIFIFQQLSQFWYDAETVETLVKVAKKVIGEKGKVALISCPTLYKQMKQECTEDNEGNVDYDLLSLLMLIFDFYF